MKINTPEFNREFAKQILLAHNYPTLPVVIYCDFDENGETTKIGHTWQGQVGESTVLDILESRDTIGDGWDRDANDKYLATDGDVAVMARCLHDWGTLPLQIEQI